jgi:GNAT superfamily N-acetyltransferase
MNNFVETLPWDTNFFSIPVGRVNTAGLDDESIQVVLDEAKHLGIRCLYFEADPNDLTTVMTVEKNNFHLVDVRVVLEYPFDSHPAPPLRYPTRPDLAVTVAVESDLPRLEEIAMEIGQFSRYTFDRNFKAGEDKRLYRLWIKNSCNGFADVVYVARWSNKGDAIGLITCTMRDNVAHIQLAGVYSEYRQKGVGSGLVQAALDWAKDQGARKMQVVTQARNVPAQRLYQQMGFFTRSMTLFYHKWI